MPRAVPASTAPTITLRGGVEIENPLEVVLGFVATYPIHELDDLSRSKSFDDGDLRVANRDGARISAAEQAAILGRRDQIEAALRAIDPHASLTESVRSIPWEPLSRLFSAFADIRAVGFAKMTKALHPKRPALIPMLDSVVQEYLGSDEPSRSFVDDAIALVRSYKRDLDRNRAALGQVKRALSRHGRRLTEVRILDLLIWSANARRSDRGKLVNAQVTRYAAWRGQGTSKEGD